MNEFRTPLQLTPGSHKIGLRTPVLTVGSCFSDAIGGALKEHKFHASVNPFGVIFNPLSIHRVIQASLGNTEFEPDSYLVNGDVHLNYHLHSQVSSLKRAELEKSIRDRLGNANTFLKNASWLMITYGTAFIYTITETGMVVANCHKQPASTFTKSLLSPEEIANSFDDLLTALKKINPQLRIILTVSPVRHIKDTIELNTVSKAVLRYACHLITTKHTDVEYFPAYEIMMDDLRDYRFYEADMIHPNEQAESYIWEQFTHRYMDDETRSFIRDWRKIRAALNHRPFHPDSSRHQVFVQRALERLREFENIVNVDEEIKLLQQQLNTEYS